MFMKCVEQRSLPDVECPKFHEIEMNVTAKSHQIFESRNPVKPVLVLVLQAEPEIDHTMSRLETLKAIFSSFCFMNCTIWHQNLDLELPDIFIYAHKVSKNLVHVVGLHHP